jgi:hypothetical protein
MKAAAPHVDRQLIVKAVQFALLWYLPGLVNFDTS